MKSLFGIAVGVIILDSAVQEDKAMQDFESESLLMRGDDSQKVKALTSKVIIAQKIVSIYPLQLPNLRYYSSKPYQNME